MKNNTNGMFEEDYFDGGKEELGVFKAYRFEDLYPEIKVLATSIKKQFDPTKVLDIGCAKGFLVKTFEDVGIEAWGADVSEYAISNAPKDVQSKLYKVDFNRDTLPFDDEYFDFVTFLGTIEYLNNHKHIINEVKRVLKEGGGLYLTTIYKRDPRDNIRINTHNKTYWINEFESNGFGFMPEKLDMILKERNVILKERFIQTFTTTQGNTIKSKLGKVLYQRGGYIGKQLIFLYRFLHTKFFSSYGILLFVKEAK